VSLRTMVQMFHRAMGQLDPESPVNPDEANRELRAHLLAEECAEGLTALVGATRARGMFLMHSVQVADKRGNEPGDLDEITDAMSDIRVIVTGTDVAFGVDGDVIDRAVMDANLRKTGGGRNLAGKFQKPPGWTPPDVAGLLRAQGWKP
jgi:predicted HAD superfamily Cof-like phosphohydrolase